MFREQRLEIGKRESALLAINITLMAFGASNVPLHLPFALLWKFLLNDSEPRKVSMNSAERDNEIVSQFAIAWTNDYYF